MKRGFLIIFLGLGFLFFGCIGENAQQKYFCENGKEVTNLSECENESIIPLNEKSKCDDGTLINTCSSEKPKFCNEDYELVDRASECGCFFGYSICSETCINENEICCIDDVCKQKFTEIINSQIEYDKNVKIKIMNFEKVSDDKKKLAEVYTLFLIENLGDTTASVYCSDFDVEALSKKEYLLRESKMNHFGETTQQSYAIKSNSTALIECYQKIDYDAELEFLEIKEGDSIVKKYPLFPKTWMEFQNLEYNYTIIGISKEQSSYIGTKGPLKVTLEKIGKKTYKDRMQVEIFWKLENLKRAGWFEYVDRIFIFPYKDTAIGINGTRYYSQYIEGEENFELKEGYLSPLETATGRVVISDVPNNSGPIKVYLVVKDFVDFWFEIKIE